LKSANSIWVNPVHAITVCKATVIDGPTRSCCGGLLGTVKDHAHSDPIRTVVKLDAIGVRIEDHQACGGGADGITLCIRHARGQETLCCA
jgi:hypothetical protein